MFTGIIEDKGEIVNIVRSEDNLTFSIKSTISDELSIDQSVSHDGVCLTIIYTENGIHKVTSIYETLVLTTLSEWNIGDEINLERSLRLGDRLDGHLVQGHVDTVGICKRVYQESGSWIIEITFPKKFSGLVISKGSIAVNGVSLTVVRPEEGKFSVAIIPFTYEHTTFKKVEPGDKVNLEFDILGKYILKNMK